MTIRERSVSENRPLVTKAGRAKERAVPGPTAIEFLCVEKGLSLTGPRKVLAQVLSASSDHPDIAELHRRVSMLDPRIALSTVYRNLRQFEALGIVERHDFGDGRARIEQTSNKHHDHLIDTHSGKVIEFRSEQIEELLADVAGRLGYRVVGYRLELFGAPADRE